MRGAPPTSRRGSRGRCALTFAQAPATSGTWPGHLLCLGQTLPSICPAMRTCSAWALPLGVAHQGISLTGGHTLLCEFQTLWDPSSQNFARQKFQDMGVCAYMCWCVYVWRGV